MNLAFQTILVVALILPGIIFHYAHATGVDPEESPFSMGTLVDEVLHGVLWSIPLHGVWILFVGLLGFEVDLHAAAVVIFSSGASPASALDKVLNVAANSAGRIAWYFASLYAGAFLTGLLTNKLSRSALASHLPFIRYKHSDLFFLLRGEAEDLPEVDGVHISAIVELGDCPWLVRGILEKFTFDKEGSLELIILTEARRRKLSDDRSSEQAPAVSDHRFYRIEGDYLVLRGQEIKTLNIDYFWLTEEADLNTEQEQTGPSTSAEDS